MGKKYSEVSSKYVSLYGDEIRIPRDSVSHFKILSEYTMRLFGFYLLSHSQKTESNVMGKDSELVHYIRASINVLRCAEVDSPNSIWRLCIAQLSKLEGLLYNQGYDSKESIVKIDLIYLFSILAIADLERKEYQELVAADFYHIYHTEADGNLAALPNDAKDSKTLFSELSRICDNVEG